MINTCSTNYPSFIIGFRQVRFSVLIFDHSATTYSALDVTHVWMLELKPIAMLGRFCVRSVKLKSDQGMMRLYIRLHLWKAVSQHKVRPAWGSVGEFRRDWWEEEEALNLEDCSLSPSRRSWGSSILTSQAVPSTGHPVATAVLGRWHLNTWYPTI